MATVIPFAIENLDEDSVDTSYTYALDLDKGRIIGMVDGLEAACQFVRKAIITQRFKSLIYDSQYGSEISEVIRCKDANEEYTETEIPRIIWDAIGIDERIISANNYEYYFNLAKDEAHIKFTVETIFGITDIEEVIT